MNKILLLILLSIDLIIIYLFNKKDIINPAVLFCFGFIVATIDLISMMKIWPYDISYKTILVLVFSPLVFEIGDKCSHIFVLKKGKNESINKRKGINIDTILQSNTKIFLIVLYFNIIVFIVHLYSIVKVTKDAGFSGGIFHLAFKYGEVKKSLIKNEINDIGFIKYFYLIVIYNSYIWGYLNAYIIAKFKKIRWDILLCWITSVFTMITEGTRGNAIYAIIGFIIIYMILNRKFSSNQYRISFSLLLKVIIAMILLIFLFNLFILISNVNVGTSDSWEYISFYLGAPILNLNSIIENKIKLPTYFGRNTFDGIYTWLSKKFNLYFPNDSQITFNSIDGKLLGNVYTIYRSIIQDFGFFGMEIFIWIMAFVTGKLYKATCKDCEKLNVSNICYIYIIPLIILSFFSNKFSEGTITIAYIYNIIFWNITIYFFKWRVEKNEKN